MFTAVEDDLEVELVPGFAGEELFEVALGLFDVFAGREFPAFCEAVDVGIHRESGHAKGLGHNDGGGFVTHTGQGFECLEICRDFSSVLFDEDFRKLRNGGRFSGRQAAWADDGADFLDWDFHHVPRVGGEGEKRWRDQIDADIRALRGKQHSDQQGEGIAVIQRDGRFRVEFFEASQQMCGPFFLEHGGTIPCAMPGCKARQCL